MRRFLWVLVVLPLVLCIVPNLIFATSWGTGFIEKRIANRLGLPCSILRVSWTPWSGLTVKEIHLLSPSGDIQVDDVLRIETIKVDPSWTSLIRGKKRFERLEIQGVTGRVSLELVQDLVARGQATPPTEPAPDPDKPAPVTPGVSETLQDAVVVVRSDPKDSAAVPTAVPDPDPASTDPSPVKGIPTDSFEGVVLFKDVNLRFFSRQYPELSAELKDSEGELPIWGGRREGSVTLGDFEIAGRYHSQRLVLPIVYEDNFLRIDERSLKIFGLDLKLKAAVRFVHGLPYGVQMELPAQHVDLSPIFPNGPPPIVVHGFRASAQLQGHLQIPSSVIGEGFLDFDRLVHRDPKDGSETNFDSGSGHLQLSSAGLIVREFRIMGDEESLLGNGFVTARGEAAAVVRLVAAPDRADALENRINQASLDLDLHFEPLVTPDREYRDFHLGLFSGIPVIDLGQDREWLPLLPVTRAVLGTRDPQPPTFP